VCDRWGACEIHPNRRNPASRALPEKPQESKKKTRQFGKVDIPQEEFTAALKVDSWGGTALLIP
jgi:hypothetical protein